MYDRLKDLIAQGDIQEALYELQNEYVHIEERTRKEAAELCVLEASIWEQLGDGQAELRAIEKGLNFDGGNYELFFMLGVYYRYLNVNKAYLCYEMSAHYCTVAEDKTEILKELENIRSDPAFRVRNLSVMILSYNDLELMKRCVAAVEKYQPEGSTEIVVVDNDSDEEGLWEFLKEKEKSGKGSFKLALLDTNLGFAPGCNMGVLMARDDNDIFFLNNDAVLMQNSLFFLRMGLYDSRDVGSCGAFSNSASLQVVDTDELWDEKPPYKEALEIFREYSRKHGIPKHLPYIKRFRLTGFALLLSREAIGAVAADGQVFDEAFSPAYFEDDDLGIRLARAGFTQYLCCNSYIYHNGGDGSFGASKGMEEGRQGFIDKWGFDIWGYSLPWFEAADAVIELAKERRGHLKVLDFTCGFGATASYIKSKCPGVFIAGVCRTSFEAGIAKHMVDDVVYGELNTVRLPWKSHSFDVVLAETIFVNKARIGENLREGGIHIGNDQEETK